MADHPPEKRSSEVVVYIPLPSSETLQARLHLSGPPLTVQTIAELKAVLDALLDDLAETKRHLAGRAPDQAE